MPLAVTLQAQQWNGVMASLQEAPYRIAAPLIESINAQLNEAISAAQQSPEVLPPQAPVANGLDHDPPEVHP
jgi:hypothetical protein